MTEYHSFKVTLSDGQKAELSRALMNKSPITIRLSNTELPGNDELMLTKTQIRRIQKAKSLGKGVDIKISRTQIKKLVQEGGSLWSSLFQLGTKLLPMAAKALPGLATGALSSVGNFTMDKILGRGQTGGFLIPQNKIDQLIQHKNLLTEAQKKQIVRAIQTGGQLVITPTVKQQGDFLGTLLASIGVSLLLNRALLEKVFRIDQNRGSEMVCKIDLICYRIDLLPFTVLGQIPPLVWA